MAKYQKNNPITVNKQYINILLKYQNIDKTHSYCKFNELHVRLKIMPTEYSETYIIEVIYKSGGIPIVLMISPKIRTYNGQRPHHLFSDCRGYPRLCLYYPKYREWTKYDYISDTIIPWISTWLLAYEFWLVTGEWHFTEAPNKEEKDESSDKDEN